MFVFHIAFLIKKNLVIVKRNNHMSCFFIMTMENYTRRSKSILSLISFVFLLSCSFKPAIQVPKPVHIDVIVPNMDDKYDSVLYWYTDDFNIKKSSIDVKQERISEVKKNYYLKNNQLFNNKNNIVDNVLINLIINDKTSISVIMRDGKPQNDLLYSIDGVPPYVYTDSGGVIPLMKELEIFKKGEGHWINYYLEDYYSNKEYEEKNNFYLKEEGDVKNNFKYGEWKYYNKKGMIDSAKTYILKDSVDVRFPHCIFNKKEPCYSEKK